MPRHDKRNYNEPRPIEIELGFQRNAEGSVLYRAGKTVVLCTASLDSDVPKWMAEKQTGWLTAEYQMHPRANPKRRESSESERPSPLIRLPKYKNLPLYTITVPSGRGRAD